MIKLTSKFWPNGTPDNKTVFTLTPNWIGSPYFQIKRDQVDNLHDRYNGCDYKTVIELLKLKNVKPWLPEKTVNEREFAIAGMAPLGPEEDPRAIFKPTIICVDIKSQAYSNVIDKARIFMNYYGGYASVNEGHVNLFKIKELIPPKSMTGYGLGGRFPGASLWLQGLEGYIQLTRVPAQLESQLRDVLRSVDLTNNYGQKDTV